MLAAALVGICAGFLRYNFHPARVFMGDAGSHFLGFTIAMLSVTKNWKAATGVAFAVPILILSVPIFDTAFAIVRRLRRGQPIFAADKGHVPRSAGGPPAVRRGPMAPSTPGRLG